jgi:hypothetical protein
MRRRIWIVIRKADLGYLVVVSEREASEYAQAAGSVRGRGGRGGQPTSGIGQ